MPIKDADYKLPDPEEGQEVRIARRVVEARNGIGLTQSEFAGQLSITRDRLASYEDCRAPLRCDLALRMCRHFFISELWLATGALNESMAKKGEHVPFSNLDARLTMSMAIEPSALSWLSTLGLSDSFGAFFNSWLKKEYFDLAAKSRGFPRITPMASDGPEYYDNAMACLLQFLKRDIAPSAWRCLFSDLVIAGQVFYKEIKTINPDTLDEKELLGARDSFYERLEKLRLEHRRKAR